MSCERRLAVKYVKDVVVVDVEMGLVARRTLKEGRVNSWDSRMDMLWILVDVCISISFETLHTDHGW